MKKDNNYKSIGVTRATHNAFTKELYKLQYRKPTKRITQDAFLITLLKKWKKQ